MTGTAPATQTLLQLKTAVDLIEASGPPLLLPEIERLGELPRRAILFAATL